MIDMKIFTRRAKEARDGFERDVENGIADRANYRQELRDAIGPYRDLWQPSEPRTLASLQAELVTASIAAGSFGATDGQIKAILDLSIDANDFSPLGSGWLTRKSADNIIIQMGRESDRRKADRAKTGDYHYRFGA